MLLNIPSKVKSLMKKNNCANPVETRLDSVRCVGHEKDSLQADRQCH